MNVRMSDSRSPREGQVVRKSTPVNAHTSDSLSSTRMSSMKTGSWSEISQAYLYANYI